MDPPTPIRVAVAASGGAPPLRKIRVAVPVAASGGAPLMRKIRVAVPVAASGGAALLRKIQAAVRTPRLGFIILNSWRGGCPRVLAVESKAGRLALYDGWCSIWDLYVGPPPVFSTAACCCPCCGSIHHTRPIFQMKVGFAPV